MKYFETFLSNYFLISLVATIALMLIGHIELSIFLIILTPVIRVLFCHIFFVCQKAPLLASYTFFTLILLILSSLGFIKIS